MIQIVYPRILSEIIKNSKKSILLLGPRQVGKSTLLNALKPDLTIDLARDEEYFAFQSNHRELIERISAQETRVVFLDEIQRIPRLLNTVQSIVDTNPKIRFFLSGSSARKLRKGKANLLPGRVFVYQMSPLCVEEFGKHWNENRSLQYGSLPGVMNLESDVDKKKLLMSYSNTYLKEEILAESLVRGVDGFVRFLKEAANHSGAFLDLSKLSKKAKIPRQSAVRHFEILEDTLIAHRVENDRELEGIDLVRHPRFFIFDLGVVNALQGSFDISADRIGSMYEHLVLNQVMHSASANDTPVEAYHFRTRGGFEIDFVFKVEAHRFTIECKSAKHVDETDVKNLKSMNRYYSKATPILIYRGSQEKKISGVWAVPLEKALKIMGLRK